MSNDPYEINVQKNRQFKEEVAGKKESHFCPKRNKTLEGDCKVCELVQQLFKNDTKEDKDRAYELMASTSVHFCFVFPHDKETLHLMIAGKKVGNQIIDGVNNFGWTDIANPKKGQGREMMIAKGNDGKNNTYTAARCDAKADWAIPKKVLDNLPDLQNDIINVLRDPEKYNVKLYNIASIKMDETVTFRICPPKELGDMPWVASFKHWGVSKSQIEGTQPLNVSDEEKEESVTNAIDKAFGSEKELPFETETSDDSEPEKAASKEQVDPPCFGKDITFEAEDPECMSCPAFKRCAKTVMKNGG